uniref:Ionotropic receptor 75a N-terminal domain-containing protein n=1 Tax=Glossina pallidipes TaxID=7398 RepID=A0A1A9ZRL9_GLOPL
MVFVFILWLLFANYCSTTAVEMQAFRDFLLNQHLKHAIIIRQQQQQQQQGQRDYLIEIRDLAMHCHIRFYRVPAKQDIENLLYKTSPKVGIYMNISDPEESLHILQDFAVKDKFKNSYAWFITMHAPAEGLFDDFKIIKNIFDPLRLHINADVTVAIRVNGSNFHLYDVYKILPDFPVTIEIKGNWSLQKGLIIDHKFNYGFMARRTNFQNISINVATVLHDKPKHFDNYTFLSNTQDWKELDPMPRKVYGLMRPMEDLYNFSFNIYYEASWGTYIDGNATGIVGRLHSHQAEFSLAPFRYLTGRVSLVDYSPEVHLERANFILRHPRHVSIRNVYLAPLAVRVWWCVLALIILTIVLLVIQIRQEYKRQSEHHVQRKQLEKHVDFAMLVAAEALLMQGPPSEIFHLISSRTLIATVCVFVFILMEFYNGYIVGSLLAESPRTLTTLEALYNSNLELGMEDIQYNYNIFKNSSSPLMHIIYKERILGANGKSHTNILPLEQGINRIARGGFAFHMSTDRAYRLLENQLNERQFCELQEIRYISGYSTGIILAKSTPYREYVAQVTLKLRESSLMQYNNKLWELHKIDCRLIKGNEIIVDMEHFAAALVFLGCAIVLSLIVLGIEIFYKKCKKLQK